MFAGEVLYEIESRQGHDISKISHIPSEEEVLFEPGSHFRVLSQRQENGLLIVRLREELIPFGDKVVFWIDDEPTNNKVLMEELYLKYINVVWAVSTKEACELVSDHTSILERNHNQLRFITDMARKEDGIWDSDAGLTFVQKLRKDFRFFHPILIYTSRKRELDISNQMKMEVNVIVTARREQCLQWASFTAEFPRSSSTAEFPRNSSSTGKRSRCLFIS